MFRFNPPQICVHCLQVMPRAAARRCPLCHTPFDYPRVMPAARPAPLPERRDDEQG